MTKPHFFYATGTAYMLALLDRGFKMLGASKTPVVAAGIDGRTAIWDGLVPNDPFPTMLDPDLWDVTKIGYPAAGFPMAWSVGVGVTKTINAIRALPPGTPFALGGMSQGAAVMSQVYREILTGSRGGLLTNWAPGFLGGTVFGNPCREVNRTWPGGLWSGAFNDGSPTSGASGSHGSFPASWRLSGTEDKWWEFVNIGDVFAAVGDDSIGAKWTALNGDLLNTNVIELLELLAQAIKPGVQSAEAAFAAISSVTGSRNFTDAVGTVFSGSGGGHVAYAWEPPPFYAAGTSTSCQIALSYLKSLAQSVAVAPIIVPTTTTAAWSTTLTPPAA